MGDMYRNMSAQVGRTLTLLGFRLADTSRQRLIGVAREHLIAIITYFLLCIVVLHPLLANFTTKIIHDGDDAISNLWLIWHTQLAILGHTQLLSAPELYYPISPSLLVHAFGPLMGIVTLPFHPLGPIAAYNAAVALGTVASAYFTYRLARVMGLPVTASILAGVIVVMAPARLSKTLGHTEHIFVGLIPLALLLLYHTMCSARWMRWSLGTAVVVTITAIHSGYQLVFVGITMILFGVYLICATRNRRHGCVRLLVTALTAIVLCGPYLVAARSAAADHRLWIRHNLSSLSISPDLAQLFTPTPMNQLYWLIWGSNSHPIGQQGFETWVYIPYTCIILCLIAVRRADARIWLTIGICCVVFALGPALRLFGQNTFTDYHLTLLLPYSILTSLPGFEFMRVPGRFMLPAFIAISIASAFGFASIVGSSMLRRVFVTTVVVTALLVETWPVSWPVQDIPDAPLFYKQVASEEGFFGILDLPTGSADFYAPYSSRYMMMQITHGKAIAAGYLARPYRTHPVFPCVFGGLRFGDVFQVNGRSVECPENGLRDLYQKGYRYIVVHKTAPEALGPDNSIMERRLVKEQIPYYEDEQVRVYRVPAWDELPPIYAAVEPGDSWYQPEPTLQWAASPATISIWSPTAQGMVLEIDIVAVHDPRSPEKIGQSGSLTIRLPCGAAWNFPVRAGGAIQVPLEVRPGSQSVWLELEGGNFRASDKGTLDLRELSFAVRRINLVTDAVVGPESLRCREEG